MENVLIGMAEYYSAELSQNVKRGMEINADKCYYNGGSVPLGLKLQPVEVINGPMGKKITKKKFAINEDIGPIVQQIFEMYANGSTMVNIIRYLNEKQIKTSQGNEFDKNSIRRILLNRKYIEIYSYQGKETKDGIPRLINDETFYKVQEKLKVNKQAPGRGKVKTPYLLTTKLYCGNCKQAMHGYSGTSGTGKLHCYYGCKKCDKSVKKEYIEDLVVKNTRDFLTNENIDKIANMVVKIAEKEKDKTNLRRLQKALRDNEKQKANLFDSLKICDINSVKKSIFEEIEKMETQRKQIEYQIIMEESNFVDITVSQVKFFLKQMKKGKIEDLKYRQMLIDVLIYRVYLYDDNITIVFSTQNKHYERRVPSISEIESSFLGTQPPPYMRV